MATPKPSGSQPMTPRSCALGCGLWLAVMALPALAFILATQNELGWQRGPGNFVQDKVFVINEPEAAGLGFLSARIVRDETATDGPLCVRTSVAYALWRNAEGGDPNAAFCQCYTRARSGAFELSPLSCPGE